MPIRPETFIARRLYFAQSQSRQQRSAARPAVRVALAGIMIGVMVMLVTICVVVGFKQTVTEKVAGFGAHIQVVNFDNNNTYEMQPVAVNDTLLGTLRQLPHVASAHLFYTKPGIIKTDNDFHGIVLKGTDYWDYFSDNLIDGSLPAQVNDVIVSQSLAAKLSLAIDAPLLCYFVEEQVRVRRFRISGIYQTGFGEFDNLFVLGLPENIRMLNGWESNQASGIEVLVDDVRNLSETADYVYFATANRLDEDGNAYYTQTLEQLNPQIFAWLDLLDMNVVVIILLMLAVSGFNIVSGLIILILDGITLIGTLKALGADNHFVRRIFITEAAMLIGKGIVWGNIMGLILCALQYFLHVIPLDSSTYYVSYVPIVFPWHWILLLNLGTVFVSLLILLAPSAIVTKISPARVMHFE